MSEQKVTRARLEELKAAREAQTRTEYGENAAERERVFKAAVEALTEAKQLFDECVRLHGEGLGPAARTRDATFVQQVARQNPRPTIGRLIYDRFREYLR